MPELIPLPMEAFTVNGGDLPLAMIRQQMIPVLRI